MSEGIRCITFRLIFHTKSHYGQLVHEFRFNLYTCIRTLVRVWAHTLYDKPLYNRKLKVKLRLHTIQLLRSKIAQVVTFCSDTSPAAYLTAWKPPCNY
jgi:hypothetical protein